MGPFAAPSRAVVPSGCYHQVWFLCWQWFVTLDNPLMHVACCLSCTYPLMPDLNAQGTQKETIIWMALITLHVLGDIFGWLVFKSHCVLSAVNFQHKGVYVHSISRSHCSLLLIFWWLVIIFTGIFLFLFFVISSLSAIWIEPRIIWLWVQC